MTSTPMRTTLNIDDELLAHAQELTGVSEKTAIVRLALETLIQREESRRIATLAGSEPGIKPVRRRRSG